jgi:hypothetical protein
MCVYVVHLAGTHAGGRRHPQLSHNEMKLEEYEQILKHDYVSDDKMRAEMQSQLEMSATAAHAMFKELMTDEGDAATAVAAGAGDGPSCSSRHIGR